MNDYLASRDAEWMGRIYRFLGLTVGTILTSMPHAAKHDAYACDIVYGTNNEFGFDYLRDNMAMAKEDRFQRSLNYAIVDEVDSILIDEARTPLIISGAAEDRTELYVRLNEVAPLLKRQEAAESPGDFWVDEKQQTILMAEKGYEAAEQMLSRAGLLPEGGSLYERGEHQPAAPPHDGAARAQPVLPRQAVRRAERRQSSSSTSSPGA